MMQNGVIKIFNKRMRCRLAVSGNAEKYGRDEKYLLHKNDEKFFALK